MGLEEIVCEIVVWIHLSHKSGQRWAFQYGNEPQGTIQSGKFPDYLG
jgi:hypothetical protein